MGFSKPFIKYVSIFLKKYKYVMQFKKHRYVTFIGHLNKLWVEEIADIVKYKNINVKITNKKI